MKSHKFLITIVIHIVLVFVTIIMLFPLIWLVSTSFKLPVDYYSSPPVWFPSNITFNHYKTLFTTYGAIPYLKNSLIVSIANTLLVLLLSIPASYSIARLKVGGNQLSFWFLSQRMLPPVASLIPLFILFSKIRLLDNYLSLIIAYTIFNLPFAIWMLIGFIQEIPRELEEAAALDGCTEIQVLWRIILPLVLPGLVVISLFCFLFAWNELMFAITFTRRNTKTLMVLLASTMQSPTGMFFGEAAAAAIIGVTPSFVLTMFLQRYLVRGLTLGAVKG